MERAFLFGQFVIALRHEKSHALGMAFLLK